MDSRRVNLGSLAFSSSLLLFVSSFSGAGVVSTTILSALSGDERVSAFMFSSEIAGDVSTTILACDVFCCCKLERYQ